MPTAHFRYFTYIISSQWSEVQTQLDIVYICTELKKYNNEKMRTDTKKTVKRLQKIMDAKNKINFHIR